MHDHLQPRTYGAFVCYDTWWQAIDESVGCSWLTACCHVHQQSSLMEKQPFTKTTTVLWLSAIPLTNGAVTTVQLPQTTAGEGLTASTAAKDLEMFSLHVQPAVNNRATVQATLGTLLVVHVFHPISKIFAKFCPLHTVYATISWRLLCCTVCQFHMQIKS